MGRRGLPAKEIKYYKSQNNMRQTFIILLLLFLTFKIVAQTNKVKIAAPPLLLDYYEEISDFRNGYAIVKLNNKYGIINKQGKKVIPLQFTKIGNEIIQNHLFSFQKEWMGNYGLMNTNGKEIIPASYSYVALSQYGYVVVMNRTNVSGKTVSKQGLLLENGTELLKPIYDYVVPISKNKIQVKLNGEVLFVNEKGAVINLNKNFDIYNCVTDSIYITNENNLYGLKHLNGLVIVEPKYAWIYFSKEDNLFFVMKDMNFGYGCLDKKGKEVIPSIYEKMGGSFKEGLLWVKKDGKSIYIDINNKSVIDSWFYQTNDFHKGFAIVKMTDGYHLIDRASKIIKSFNFFKLSQFSDGVAKVEFKDSSIGFVNEIGDLLMVTDIKKKPSKDDSDDLMIEPPKSKN
jgi:hypothetical protein